MGDRGREAGRRRLSPMPAAIVQTPCGDDKELERLEFQGFRPTQKKQFPPLTGLLRIVYTATGRKDLHMDYEELIKGFAERFGIADLTSEDGVASVDVDGMDILMAADDPGRAIVLAGSIGEPPPENAASFATLLLQANRDLLAVGGCGFAQNRDTGAYVLLRRLARESLDLDAFCAALDDFVNKLETWTRLLADFRPAAGAAAAAAANAEAETPARWDGGFLPV